MKFLIIILFVNLFLGKNPEITETFDDGVPVETLKLYFRQEKKLAKQVYGYNVAKNHPFSLGTVYPEWSSCRIDTVGRRKRQVVEYHFPVRTEFVEYALYRYRGAAVKSSQAKKYGTSVDTELVFRFRNDGLEYMGLRCVVAKNPEDKDDFRSGLVVDLNPFSNELYSLWRYEGGRIVQEHLWLDSPTYNPNYSSYDERNGGMATSVLAKVGIAQSGMFSYGMSSRRASEWTKIYFQFNQYRYYRYRNCL